MTDDEIDDEIVDRDRADAVHKMADDVLSELDFERMLATDDDEDQNDDELAWSFADALVGRKSMTPHVHTWQLVSVPRWGTTWIFKLLIFVGLRKVILVQPLRWLLLRDVE